MSQPAQAEPPAQNPPETPKRGKPFTSGDTRQNKGGRPRGLARRVREVVGDDGDMLINVMSHHATGWNIVVHPESRIECWERVSVGDQQAALRWLADRGFGKPPEFVPIEEADPLGLTDGQDASIADRLEARVIQLAERRKARDAVDTPEA